MYKFYFKTGEKAVPAGYDYEATDIYSRIKFIFDESSTGAYERDLGTGL